MTRMRSGVRLPLRPPTLSWGFPLGGPPPGRSKEPGGRATCAIENAVTRLGSLRQVCRPLVQLGNNVGTDVAVSPYAAGGPAVWARSAPSRHGGLVLAALGEPIGAGHWLIRERQLGPRRPLQGVRTAPADRQRRHPERPHPGHRVPHLMHPHPPTASCARPSWLPSSPSALTALKVSLPTKPHTLPVTRPTRWRGELGSWLSVAASSRSVVTDAAGSLVYLPNDEGALVLIDALSAQCGRSEMAPSI